MYGWSNNCGMRLTNWIALRYNEEIYIEMVFVPRKCSKVAFFKGTHSHATTTFKYVNLEEHCIYLRECNGLEKIGKKF